MTLDRPPLVRYFGRLGATHDAAQELAEAFDTASAFLDASFQERLEAVVGPRQAAAIAAEYDDFEHFRDWASYQQIAALDGVGRQSASDVSRAFISSTIHTPRDQIHADGLAEKMGLYDPDRDAPSEPQSNLGRWADA